LDHDLARIWKNYYHGSFLMDDVELHKMEINRLGNVIIPNDSYGSIIEKKMSKFLKEIYSEKKEMSTYEFIWEIGKKIKDKNSILYWCYKNKIPMIVPGITDGAVGYQIWQFSQDHDIKINILKDEQLMSDLVWNAKKSGALIIGGGISKHHTIWWNQFKNGLDYVVYITTAVEWDGSLSGARPREAISWGKVKEKAKMVTVQEDATIALPIIFASLLERL
jgi:deoxyhypusine synthase